MALTAVPVHFHRLKVGKTPVMGCLERSISIMQNLLNPHDAHFERLSSRKREYDFNSTISNIGIIKVIMLQ